MKLLEEDQMLLEDDLDWTLLEDDLDVVVEVEEDPDVVDVMGIGRDVDWKDLDVVAGWGLDGTLIGRDGSGRCCWRGVGRVVDWKDLDCIARGLEGTSIGMIRTSLLEGNLEESGRRRWIGIGREVDPTLLEEDPRLLEDNSNAVAGSG